MVSHLHGAQESIVQLHPLRVRNWLPIAGIPHADRVLTDRNRLVAANWRRHDDTAHCSAGQHGHIWVRNIGSVPPSHWLCVKWALQPAA